MVLHIAGSVVLDYISSGYYISIFVGVTSFLVTKAWFAGKRTNRERDLHGRTVLLTGASSALGITLTTELARRGAQVVAVVPDLSDPAFLSLIDLIRHTTKNELVYAEACDLTSPTAIKDFCARFIKSSGGGVDSEPPRLDAIIFAHEYPQIGAFRGSVAEKADEARRRRETCLASFFFTTLLLPVLLTAPQERDIRFISVVPPFYGAAVPSFDPKSKEEHASKSTSIWIEEGRRSLGAILLMRHLQRVLDALPSTSIRTRMPSSGLASPGNVKTTEAEAVAAKRPSNIIALSVSPGISRWDTLAPFMRADRGSTSFSVLGLLCYIVTLPFLYLFAKSSEAAIQSVLHALFLPNIIKIAEKPDPLAPKTATGKQATKEFIQGGMLYAECERVRLPGDAEKRFGDEEGGQQIWENLELELAEWRKSEVKTSNEDQRAPKI